MPQWSTGGGVLDVEVIGRHRFEDACGADLVTASAWRTDTDPRYAEVQTGGEAAFAMFMAEKLPELLEICRSCSGVIVGGFVGSAAILTDTANAPIVSRGSAIPDKLVSRRT